MERSGAIASSPLIRRLGDASYSTYLTHFFVTQAATKLALVFGVAGFWEVSLVIVLTFVMVGLTGLVVHATIEKPMSRAARRWLSSPEAPKQGPAPVSDQGTIAPTVST
jgi:peptidoglycan/LPS O-acetylase OafA/YrhL